VPVPPPPPPPRRPPTPLANEALDDEPLDSLAAPSAREIEAADESAGAAGLFERRPTDDEHARFDGAGGRPLATARRPGSALPAEALAPQPERESPALSQPGQHGMAGEAGPPDALDLLLADPAVTQILICGPDAAFVDRGSGLAPVAPALGDPNAVADALWRIANTAVPPPPPDNPVVDVRLPDGTRLAAVFPPAAPRGIAAALRKPGLAERAVADLCPAGARELVTILEAAVATQRNLLCTGDAAAVTALVSALAGAIPAERRVVVVGGGPARARPGWTELLPAGDLPGLVRVAVALRANHLLFAEGTGQEVPDLLLAAARGQEGLVLALPARTAAEGLARLEALTAPALGAGGAPAAPLVASTVDLVAHAVTGPDGTARIVELAEPVLPADDRGGRLRAEPVAVWRGDGGRRGGPNGKLEVQGVSARLGAALAAAGTSLPSSLVRSK
jgi:pilus assembly protein CpaF